nr:carbamoyltransferase HypF [Desulfobulbaceae bacterium]
MDANPQATVTLEILGLVQGVGFRPFIYSLAKTYGLTGHVKNTPSGVLIEAAGNLTSLKQFIADIPIKAPTAALVQSINYTYHDITDKHPTPSFSILESSADGTRTVFIPPDMDMCDQCHTALFEPSGRRYLYPFINCTNCGPRYTLILDLPYDRAFTSMNSFELCPQCSAEYCDPENRRFHAQPNACRQCGPQMQIIKADGTPCAGESSPVQLAAFHLSQGSILAIKGVGGFHLAVDANNCSAIERLRARKGRPDKPLALMARNIKAITAFAQVSSAEEKLLNSRQKPIVLLRKKVPFFLPDTIAPTNKFIGVMLPYSPIHHLLFHNAPYDSLVMTSGNLSEEPIVKNNEEALAKLSAVADYFLLHNRNIVTSNDDSVVYVQRDSPVFLRRSRSYAPAPITLDFNAAHTLAVGGALKNALCITKDYHYFLSQHIGDLGHYESTQHFVSIASNLQHMLNAKPNLVVHDLHPDYYSTRFALALGLPCVAVQHHHAHAVSCMAENNLQGPVIGIILDGTGFGADGTIWGGEILTATHAGFERSAHFESIALPGGDAAVREPWRMAISYLLHAYDHDLPSINLKLLQNHKTEVHLITQMITKGINSPLTSSCGRLFDAVSAILNLREHITFEGQAAIALEMIASELAHPPYPFFIGFNSDHKNLMLSFKETITEIVNDIGNDIEPSIISKRFHETIAEAVTIACKKIRSNNGIREIVLSGG